MFFKGDEALINDEFSVKWTVVNCVTITFPKILLFLTQLCFIERIYPSRENNDETEDVYMGSPSAKVNSFSPVVNTTKLAVKNL